MIRLEEVTPRRDIQIATRLVSIQRAAYAIEAELIGDDRIPQLREDIDGLRAAGLRWLAAIEADQIVGGLAWSVSDTEFDIERLVVDPAWHRRGVGIALVRKAVELAADLTIIVSTGRANVPARTLYERLGFHHTGDVEVIDGLWVSRYLQQPFDHMDHGQRH